MPAGWAIPVAGTAVLLFFFSGVPITVEGVLTAPLKVIRGPLFWMQPDEIVRTRRGVWWYVGLLGRSPIILIGGIAGGIFALRSRRPVVVGVAMIFVFFFGLHTFVTKQPRRFILYMIVPLCLLAGYAVAITFERINFNQQRVASVATGMILLVSLLAGVGGPAMVTGIDSPNKLYPEWGLDDGQEEALETGSTFSAETGCPVHVVDNSVNHQVSNWYLRGSDFTHGNWDQNVNFKENPHVIVSNEPPNVSYSSRSIVSGGFIVTWPQQHC